MRLIFPPMLALAVLVGLIGAEKSRLPATVHLNASGLQNPEEQRHDEITKQTISAYCLSCHGEEMIEQQRLTPAQWKAEIEKMVSWGAALPADQHSRVIDYLSRSFGLDAPRPLVRIVDGDGLEGLRLSPEKPPPHLLPGTSAERGADLYTRNCANCHGSRGEGNELGPRLANQPILLHPAEFVEVTSRGRRRMPASSGVLNVEQCHDILSWLIRQTLTELQG